MDPHLQILKVFLNNFWFAPADAFSRAAETILWQTVNFRPPVLDIGCGDGSISRLIFKNRNINLGIDINPQAVKQAQACSVYRQTMVMDAANMTLKANSFNTIVSNSTLEHIKPDLQVVRQVSRVLRKKGQFIFTVPSQRFSLALKEIASSEADIKALNRRLSHFHYRSLSQWRKILNQSGLKIVSYKYFFPPEMLKTWYRLFRLFTFKPYKRELWSYLQDSPYGKLVPQKLAACLTFHYLKKPFRSLLSEKGCLLFIVAQKQ